MNIEEKAKRYAQSVVDGSVEDYIGDEIYNSYIEYASQCFTAGYTQAITAGYTQAVTDLNAENEKLREALRELVDKVNMLTYSIVEEDIEVNHDFFAETMDSLAKAKQLITEP